MGSKGPKGILIHVSVVFGNLLFFWVKHNQPHKTGPKQNSRLIRGEITQVKPIYFGPCIGATGMFMVLSNWIITPIIISRF